MSKQFFVYLCTAMYMYILCGNLYKIGPITVALELDPNKDNNSTYTESNFKPFSRLRGP